MLRQLVEGDSRLRGPDDSHGARGGRADDFKQNKTVFWWLLWVDICDPFSDSNSHIL